jgi:protein-S-isoprenylcysteine O-methyltransferase Ste14
MTNSPHKPPRILPPVYLLVGIIVMFALHFLLPARQIVSGPWRWAGAVPIVAGLGLIVWIAVLFNRHHTTIKPGEVSNRLLTGGPFRVSRNPIYLGMVMVLAGIALALGSATPWIVLPLFVVVISRNVIPVEEDMLADAFGEQYAQYCTHVRRWI